jgi:ribosomal protein L9
MSKSPAPVVMVHGAFCGGWTFDAFRAPFEAAGHKVDSKKILLENPIKELGIFGVPVKLHTNITASVKVWIVNA